MISIIVPTIGRAQGFLAMLASALAGAAGFECEVVVVTDDDETIAACQDKPVRVVQQTCNAVEGFNIGAQNSIGDWLVLAADDVRFYPGWLKIALDTPNAGFIGLYEGVTWTDDVGHYMISRRFACEVFGGVLEPPCYKSWYGDIEACALARSAGRYAKTKEIILDHLHYSLGKSPFDTTYARGQAWHKDDEAIFKQRQAAGFPIDWHPMIARIYEYS